MKLWTRLCFFLVLALSSLFGGRTETTAPPQPDRHETTGSPDTGPQSPTSPPPDESARRPAPTSPPPQTDASVKATDLSPTDVTILGETSPAEDGDNKHKEITEGQNSSTAGTTAPVGEPESGRDGDNGDDQRVVSTARPSASPGPVMIEDKGPSSWGYVVLVLIILVIVALCVILYILRRVSRTYSFDLQRPPPVNHVNEPTGTFEPVYLDDLERPSPADQVSTDDLSPPAVANGTTPQPDEKSSNNENAPQEQPDANGVEHLPAGDPGPSGADNPADKTPGLLSSTNLLLDAIGDDQKNENNNNPSVCSSDPFVEINLDDPAWCDQLLSSPEAPSSVLPFTSFSFSSSSSSS